MSLPVKKTVGKGLPGPGRPKGSRNKRSLDFEAKVKEYAGDALAALLYIAREGESESARVSAAVELLNRAYGKARQAVEVTGEGGGPVEVSVTHRVVDAN